MKRLSEKEAIRRHRLMWNWIADETIRTGKFVLKEDAFAHFGWEPLPQHHNCWCCAYNHEHGHQFCRDDTCIIRWAHDSGCVDLADSEFKLWCCETDIRKSAELARQIAELPERK